MTEPVELTAPAKVLITKYILWWVASISSFLLLVLGVVGFSVLSIVKENGEATAKSAVQEHIEKLSKQTDQVDQRIDSLVVNTQDRIDRIIARSDAHRIKAIAEIQDTLTRAELAEQRMSQFEAEVKANESLVASLNEIAKDVNGLANAIAGNSDFKKTVASALLIFPKGLCYLSIKAVALKAGLYLRLSKEELSWVLANQKG